MEKPDPIALESVALLFEKTEDVEVLMLGYDDNVDLTPCDVGECPPMSQETALFEKTEDVEVFMLGYDNDVDLSPCDVGECPPMSEGTAKHNGTGIFTNFENEVTTPDSSAEDSNDDQALYPRRRRSYSLREIKQEEKEENYVHVRQRTHPRRRRSERRRTIRSGLNLLMPRNHLEKEDSSDTKDDTDMASDEVSTPDATQVCAVTTDQCTNDERINPTTTAGTSKNDDLNDKSIKLETENIGDISNGNNELTQSDDTEIPLENTSVGINEDSSFNPNAGKASCVGKRDENVTMYDEVSADSTDSSSPESGSVSSSSPPPLPPGPPPDTSLLRKESFAIVGTSGKHCPARVTGAGSPANFADQLISALSSAAVNEGNDSNDSDTSSQLGPSTHNALQKIQPDTRPKSPQDELELSISSSSSARGSLASIFNGLFGIPKEVTQSSRNLLDDVNNRCTSFSKSETCLLNLSGAAQIKSRGRRSNTVGQTGSKTFLATDTEHTSEIREVDSSADRVQSTNGMKLAFSTSCLADTTIDSEFLHFIQKEARINEPADVVDAVNDVDFMSPAERNEFEEFCDTICDEEPEELSPHLRSIENEDPTQTLIKHLLEKPLEQTTVEPSTKPPDDHTINYETSEHCSQLCTLDGVEISSSHDTTPQLDSMFSIVPSALLSQRPLSFVRMTSLTEDEVDNSPHQNLTDESNARANKDHMTLPLASSTSVSNDISPPPLPPKSASFRQTRESLKIELSERRGRSLNLEDDRKSNSPPPLPPRRGGSLVISGTPEMMQRLPPSTTITKLSSIAGTPNGDNTQPIPVYRSPKCPRQLRDRNCISSIIPDNEIPSPVEKNNFSDPNLSTTTIFSPDPPELPPRNGNFPNVEHSHSNQIPEPFTQVPPPRPPPFFRSMSTREGGMEKAAAFVMTSQSHRSCGRTRSLKNYGDQLADKEWIEARNEMIDIEIITSSASSSIPPLDPCPEPPFQHFPVKLDGTHHRLSLVSSSSSECHPSLQSHSNGAFILTGDEKLDLADTRSDAQSIKQKLLLRQKSSSSSSDTDCSRKFNSASRTSSTNTSGRRREKFLAGLKVEGTTTSSVNLLSNEAPVPSDGTIQLGASSFYDLSADNHAFVRDRQDSTISSAYDDKASDDLSQITRSRRMAKRISNVYSAVGWSSRKKEDKKTAKSKEIPFRSMMARFPFLRETSARGVPSDLNTLMDSALSLNDFDGYNEGSNLKIQSGPRKLEAGREQRSRSCLGEEILRKDSVGPEPSCSPRYSAGMADQMRNMMMVDEVDDANKQEANNNSNQKNSEKIILALDNLKRDMIEYTTVLESLQKTYEEMRSKTPDGIRQRFDLAFKEVKVMHQLQLELNSWIIKDNVDLSVVAEAFKTKDFSTYKRYSILARDLQKEIKSHSSYFNENFEKFSLNIMKPFHRLNTYSQYLQSFQNNYLDETESKLQEAVSYLNNLKQEANTEMNICDMQKCPVELRLAGLISFSGHLHHDGDLLPKQVYVILFESILVICEDNHDYRVYKQHYRSEQVAEIREGGELEIEIKVHPTFQSDTIQLKFKANLTSERKTWMVRLQAWQERNRPSFKTIILNSDLQRNIHLKHDRFLPLSLWTLSPSLKETIDTVKHNRVDEKTIKLNKIHNISRPNSGEDAIFNSFMVNVEDFVSRLDVLLDQEARAPPQLLGSILRKMRRFYKSVFLPQLRADFEKQPERILKSIVGNLPNFPPLFREYIEVRSGLTLMMEDGLNCNQYISPFKHLSFFIEWLFTLSCIAKYHVKLRGQLAILVNCVEDARVTLLHSAIVNCQLDFYKTGDIVRNGNLESKVKCRSIKGNQDYHVILFEKAILFTRAKIPQYEYVQILWLDQMTFGPQPDHKCSFRLEERAAKKIYVYELKAKDELQKKEWQNSIHKQLHRQVEFVKKNLS